jgi:hypothetical protein
LTGTKEEGHLRKEEVRIGQIEAICAQHTTINSASKVLSLHGSIGKSLPIRGHCPNAPCATYCSACVHTPRSSGKLSQSKAVPQHQFVLFVLLLCIFVFMYICIICITETCALSLALICINETCALSLALICIIETCALSTGILVNTWIYLFFHKFGSGQKRG